MGEEDLEYMYIPYSILKMSPQISILKFHGTGIPEPSETADHTLKITGNGSHVYVCVHTHALIGDLKISDFRISVCTSYFLEVCVRRLEGSGYPRTPVLLSFLDDNNLAVSPSKGWVR